MLESADERGRDDPRVPVGLVEEVGQKGRKHLMTSMIYGRYLIPKGVTVSIRAGGKSNVNKKEKSQGTPLLATFYRALVQCMRSFYHNYVNRKRA